jgi:hypothetical protein
VHVEVLPAGSVAVAKNAVAAFDTTLAAIEKLPPPPANPDATGEPLQSGVV